MTLLHTHHFSTTKSNCDKIYGIKKLTFSLLLNRSRHNCEKSYGKKLSFDFLKSLGISLKIQLPCLAVLYKYDWKIFYDATEGLHEFIVGP